MLVYKSKYRIEPFPECTKYNRAVVKSKAKLSAGIEQLTRVSLLEPSNELFSIKYNFDDSFLCDQYIVPLFIKQKVFIIFKLQVSKRFKHTLMDVRRYLEHLVNQYECL